MSKDKISDYSATANSNTDIAGINIDEGCAPSGINNAIRTLMKQIKDLYAGTSGDKWPVASGGTGATSASDARTNLGLAIGTDVQAYSTELAAISASGNAMYKNRIINGAMMIDQRNAGASVTPATANYTLDRWQYQAAQASKVSIQQNAASVAPPSGFSNYLGVTSLSAYSVGASESFYVVQRVEGFNFADMAWGTASAATVTLSFWVRSSLTGTFGAALWNSAANRAYPVSYTISSANTWEQKTITIVGDTTGTWIGATNGIGVNIVFGLGFGSSLSGTSGVWNAGTAFAPTGATSVVGTNGATFYITGVQLEKGSTATSFDYRPYGTELALCQRYYEIVNFTMASYAASASSYGFGYPFKVTKRTTSPTLTRTGSWATSNENNTVASTNGAESFYVYITTSGAGQFIVGGIFNANAEL